ncbi:MAG: hypothetical protein ACM3JB_07240 [Acidobacteriaceae bacterium]
MFITHVDPPIGGVDARSTTTETINQTSMGMSVSLADASPAAPIAVSLDSSVQDYFTCWILNESTQTATFTASSGDVNDGSGAAPSVALGAGESCALFKTSSGSPAVAHWKMLKGTRGDAGGVYVNGA